MRHQLNRLICQLRRQGCAQPSVVRSAQTPQALEQAAEIDARTNWPTHRIRSFLLTQCAKRRAD